MDKPIIPPLPAFPVRGEGREAFATKANAHVAALPVWSGKITEMGDYVNDRANAARLSESNAAQRVVDAQAKVTLANQAADNAANNAETAGQAAIIAESAANFKGDWSRLTGSVATPATVRHDGMIWVLMQNLADITIHEPGVSAVWSVSPSFALIYAAL